MRQPRRQRRFAVALVALALVAAGCTDAADDGALPAATPTSDTAPSAPTAATTTTAATTLAADATPAATDPGSAPQDHVETDPRDAYFDLDRVLDISIEIDVEDWNTLRHQTRTLADVFAEIEEYGLSRPFASIYTWFSATVTVDGQTHADVGVRKKGFVGSQSSTKPSLKLRFDKYVDGQSLPGDMSRMTLNNSVQDPSMVNTCLSYLVFAAAGNPAPRCNFATVSVNGADLGLYVHVEEFKAPFLSHHFGNADGNLYEGTVSDFTLEFRGTFEKKTNEDADDWSDIDAVVAALSDPSDAGLTALESIVDLDRFLSFWATEVLVGHWDGYAGDRNNYWFYRVPGGRFVFLPWGTDGTFHLSDDPNPFDNISDPPPSVLALTAIPNRLYNHPDWRAKYVARLKQILNDVWDETDLLSAVDAMAAIVQQHALPAEARAAEADTERVRDVHRQASRRNSCGPLARATRMAPARGFRAIRRGFRNPRNHLRDDLGKQLESQPRSGRERSTACCSTAPPNRPNAPGSSPVTPIPRRASCFRASMCPLPSSSLGLVPTARSTECRWSSTPAKSRRAERWSSAWTPSPEESGRSRRERRRRRASRPSPRARWNCQAAGRLPAL